MLIYNSTCLYIIQHEVPRPRPRVPRALETHGSSEALHGRRGGPFFEIYRNYIKNTIFYKIRKIDKNRLFIYIKNTLDLKN